MSKISRVNLTQGVGDGSALWTFLNDLVDDLKNTSDLANNLKTQYDDLVTKYNAHVHVENADVAYTQNASVAAVVAGSQGSATTVAAVTLGTTK